MHTASARAGDKQQSPAATKWNRASTCGGKSLASSQRPYESQEILEHLAQGIGCQAMGWPHSDRAQTHTQNQLEDFFRPDQTWFVKSINIQEAKTHLSRLLEEAVAGEDIVIAKAGRPYVRLVPCQSDRVPRVLGGWKGKIRIAADFDEIPDSLIASFEGK